MSELKKPWLVNEAVDFLETYLTDQMTMLEFGSGYSTLWFQTKVKQIFSIEYNKQWYDDISKQASSNCNLIFVDAVETVPNDETVPSYSYIVDQYEDEFFDFILVDGRNRVDCFLKCDRVLKAGGVIMLDNSERPEYSEVFKFYENKKLFEVFGDYGWKTSWWIK